MVSWFKQVLMFRVPAEYKQASERVFLCLKKVIWTYLWSDQLFFNFVLNVLQGICLEVSFALVDSDMC